MKKRIAKIITAGLLVGLTMLMVQTAFDIDAKVMFSYYWKLAILFLVLVLLVNLVYFFVMSRKVNRAMALYEQGQVQAFISDMEALLQKAKGAPIRNVIKANLSAGYFEAKQYRKCLELLDSIARESIKDERLDLVCALNRCNALFKLQEYAAFQTAYQEKTALFAKFAHHDAYAEPIALLPVLDFVVKKEYPEALDTLRAIQQRWPESRYRGEYEALEKVIVEENRR